MYEWCSICSGGCGGGACCADGVRGQTCDRVCLTSRAVRKYDDDDDHDDDADERAGRSGVVWCFNDLSNRITMQWFREGDCECECERVRACLGA